MIELLPSSIIIHDYKLGESKNLERSLSVWDPNYFKVTYKAILDDDKGNIIIPRGYSLSYLKKLFPNKEIIDNTLIKFDPYNKSIFNVNSKPRNSRQQNAINFLNADNSYFGFAANKSQKLISLNTGDGKTFITIYFASKLQRTTLIIVDQDNFIKQWNDEFLKLTDLKQEEIYNIVGIDSIKKILKDKETISKNKVYLASHRTLASYGKNNPFLIGKLLKKLKIGLKVFDEAHVEWKNTVLIDSVSNTALTIYLTATPSRSNKFQDIVYQNIFEGIVQYGLEFKFKEENNYHKVVYIDFNSKPDVNIQAKCSNKYGFDINLWSTYITEEKLPIMSNLLRDILNDIVYKNREKSKIAIVLHTLNSVQIIYNEMKRLFPNKTIGNFTTLVKNKEDELKNEIIITTDKSFGKGINVMDLEILINTVPFSSKVLLEQLLGRLRYVKGKPTIFFDLTDNGFTACKNQKRYRKELLDMKAKSTFHIIK